MTVNPRLHEAVEIFRELGWDTADVADAPTLPLGTKEQQKVALAGLRTGDWGEYGKVGPDTYGWISAVDVDETMLALFELRLGVIPHWALWLLQHADDVVLARCVAQRGEAYAAEFIDEVCLPLLRASEHSLSAHGAAAVRLVCDLGLAVPEKSTTSKTGQWWRLRRLPVTSPKSHGLKNMRSRPLKNCALHLTSTGGQHCIQVYP